MTPIESWLAEATRGLSPESAARVRQEIQAHYDSSNEAGEDGLEALGDPRAANRSYRKVLLTETEAIMAPVLVKPHTPSLPSRVAALAVSAVFLFWQYQVRPADWPVTLAIFSTLPLGWFLPQTTIEKTRLFLYIHGLRNAVVIAVAWWYQGWENALTLGVVCFVLDYFVSYRRIAVFRKLDAGQTYGPLPGEPELTHTEAIWLNTLRKGRMRSEDIATAVLFAMLIGIAVWLPATFAPVAVCTAVGFVWQRLLWSYTENSRWFRLARWSMMLVAGAVPVLYGARAPWTSAVLLAFFFMLFDFKSIALRRKLPVSEWPKRLHW